MLKLSLPHINLLSKCDLLPQSELDSILNTQSARDIPLTLNADNTMLNELTKDLQDIIDDFSQVAFLPLNVRDEDSIGERCKKNTLFTCVISNKREFKYN